MKPGAVVAGVPWLATNSREGIRDEAARSLVDVGAMIERELPKTSPKGRYRLVESFAALFDPSFTDDERARRMADWRAAHLSRSELARLKILAARSEANVTLPDGRTTTLSTGPSERIIKPVIEEFAKRFLCEPAVLSYSDGGDPMAYIDEGLMSRLGLLFKPGDPLPDVLLAEVDPPFRLVFVEAVASDGPIDELRVSAISDWLQTSGYSIGDAVFVTAYLDRAEAAFRKTIDRIAWNSAVWFASEPDNLLVAIDGTTVNRLDEIPGLRRS